MLRFRHKMRPKKLKVEDFGGPEARIQRLRQLVSGLVRSFLGTTITNPKIFLEQMKLIYILLKLFYPLHIIENNFEKYLEIKKLLDIVL